MTEDALTTDTKKAITLTGNGYKLAIDDELTSAEQDEFWTISGTTLATYTAMSDNLLYSDNYGTQPQIDSLLAESADYSIGEIATSNTANLTQEKTQLTFAKK